MDEIDFSEANSPDEGGFTYVRSKSRWQKKASTLSAPITDFIA